MTRTEDFLKDLVIAAAIINIGRKEMKAEAKTIDTVCMNCPSTKDRETGDWVKHNQDYFEALKKRMKRISHGYCSIECAEEGMDYPLGAEMGVYQ